MNEANLLEIRRGSVSALDMAIFLSQCAILLNAGVPVVRALTVLAQQTHSPSFTEIIEKIRIEIESGHSFARALQKFPDVFDTLTVSAVHTGEASGVLDAIMTKLAAHKKREMELAGKVKAAFTYPCTIFFCSIVLIFFVSQFFLSNMLPLLISQGLEPSWYTIALMTVSSFLNHPLTITILLALIVTAPPYLSRAMRKPSVRHRIDGWLWRMPLIGAMMKKVELARFCYQFTFMFESGIPLLKSLGLICANCGSLHMQQSLNTAINHLREGESLWACFKSAGIFPQSFIQMIKVGETSGKLSLCLRNLAEYYEQDVSSSVETLAAALEPIMMGAIGLFVAVMIIILLWPLQSVITHLGL